MNLKAIKNKVSLLDYVVSTGAKVKHIGGKSYRVNPCPICNHKEHFTINTEGNYYKSFSDCCKGGSVIDYLMEVEGMEKADAIKKVEQLAGGPVITRLDDVNNTLDKETRSLIERAHENNTQYYYNRGLSDKTIKAYRLGYIPNGHKQGKAFKFILPVSDSFCILRSDNDTDRYRNIGSPIPLNLGYLNDTDTKEIFITEGYFDALSLEEIGQAAISINSTSGVGKLVDAMEENLQQIKDKLFIIALDQDDAGRKSAAELTKKADAMNLHYIIFDLNGYKDINEALVKDRAGLSKQVEDVLHEWEDKIKYRGTVYEYLNEEYELDQARRLSEKDISTGIPKLDQALGGGLYPGLYVLGAISSLGKTALALQLADTIAKSGQPVIFYSLEMGRYEMIARSLTREYFHKTKDESITTAMVIRPTAENDIFSSIEFRMVVDNYKEGAAKNLYLIEGDFKTTISTLENIPQNMRPIIIVDYLQVIQPEPDSRLSDKQHIDQVTVRLKQLSRRLDMPVIVVSSFNRASYNDDDGPKMEAFKESGAIEYGADVLLYMGLRKNSGEDPNKIKVEYPRPLNLFILKNRRGSAFDTIPLDYYTKQNYFIQPVR